MRGLICGSQWTRYADVLRKLVGIQKRQWSDKDENADRWYNGMSFSVSWAGEVWAGEACDRLCQPTCENLGLKCKASTDFLWTVDWSSDHLLKPEVLLSYVVSLPSLCEPAQPHLSAPESGDEDNPNENEDTVEENTKFVAIEEDGNIFDLLDHTLLLVESCLFFFPFL